MPFRRFREAIRARLDDTAAAARTDIPGGEIRDQIRGGTGGVLPPAGNTGTGYTPGDDSVTTAKIADDAVTFAKLQNIATDRLIGRDTASTGDPEQITVGGGVEFTGSGGIQRSALTGDVTASAGSGATTLANSGVSAATYGDATHVPQIAVDAKGRITSASNVVISALSNPMTTQDDIIIGGASGTPTRLAKGSDGQVLTVDPTTHHLVWATPSTGLTDPTTTRGDLIVRGASSTTRLAVGAANRLLRSDGTDPSWGQVVEADLNLTDITTANVSTSKHGFAPKLPNDATKYLDGTGAYSVPSGGSALTVEEVDGSPTDSAVTKIVFPNGTLAIASHVATYTPTGGGGTTVSTGTAAVTIGGLAGSADRNGVAGAGTAREFESGDSAPTWTPSTPATVDVGSTYASHLYMAATDGTERFGTYSWSPAGDFDARCKITIGAGSSVGSSGLLITDSGNTNRILFLFAQASDQATSPYQNSIIWVAQPYTYASSTYTQRGKSMRVPINTIYQRIKRTSSTIEWLASADGMLWLSLGTFSFSLTVAKLGWRVSDNVVQVAVDWLRTDV